MREPVLEYSHDSRFESTHHDCRIWEFTQDCPDLEAWEDDKLYFSPAAFEGGEWEAPYRITRGPWGKERGIAWVAEDQVADLMPPDTPEQLPGLVPPLIPFTEGTYLPTGKPMRVWQLGPLGLTAFRQLGMGPGELLLLIGEEFFRKSGGQPKRLSAVQAVIAEDLLSLSEGDSGL